MRKILFTLLLVVSFSSFASAEDPFFEAEFVFDPDKFDRGHVHASCIVELPNGDLRVVWYENGELMPPPFFSQQKDKSDDVRIGGSRKSKDGEWEAPFVAADTYACSDNNPCMIVDREGKLWLFYPTLLGVPGHTWGSALLQYKISEDYDQPGMPVWKKEGVIIPKPTGIPELMESLKPIMQERGLSEDRLARVMENLKDPLKIRLGWMPRAHPLLRSDGAIVLPVANENFSIPAMCITEDGGETWTYSSPVPYAGIIQPTVVEWEDGSLTAFFRGGGDDPRIPMSQSKDGGLTWSPVERTELIHPGSGFEATVLKGGRLAVVYNDKAEGPRDRLAIEFSDDRGKTWVGRRTIEHIPDGRFDYPSIIQAKDGSLHVTYSYNLKTVKHVRFNEAWVMAGDGA